MKNDILLKEFADHIPQVFWKALPNFKKIIYVSPAYETVWGKSTEALYQNPLDWFESIAAADQDKVKDSFSRLSKVNPNETVEFRMNRPDGYDKYIIASATLIHDEKEDADFIIGIATDITQQKKSEKRIEIQNRVTKLLSEIGSFHEVMPQIIKLICLELDWVCGEFWRLGSNPHELKYILGWNKNHPQYNMFEEIAKKMIVPISVGLPGVVLANKKAAWAENLQNDPHFSRALQAKQAGIHGACAFPIIAENEVMGVMEFFNENILPRDEDLLMVLSNIGEQIGQYTRRKHAEAELDHMAHHDMLTGLANRTLLINVLTQAIENARRKDEKIAVLFLDLDRFKHINDTFGHEAGDAFLKVMGERLLARVRKQDTVARIGGDEFVVILTSIKKFDTVQLVAEKILEVLAKPFNIKGQDFYVTTSIGISVFPNDGQEGKVLLGKADIAMYQAKEYGGNNFQFCTMEMTEIAKEKATLEIDLHHAISQKEFIIYYQPKIDIMKKTITGVEALLYWNRQGKIIAPNDFLPLAEETGLIVPIGEWTLKTACEQGKKWADMGIPLTVSVNLSSRQILFAKLLEYVRSTLHQCRLSEKNLELEITESLLMQNTEASIALVKALRNLNIQIAIDDFGTGYSSLMYLKQFSVNRLKIDKNFIMGISSNASDRTIARTIIVLAHSLGIKVVAEGVETEEQYHYLKTHHCDEAQGFYFCRPLPEKEITQFLIKNDLGKIL